MTNKALILRTSQKDLQSRNGFQWPEQGPVEAPDWDPTPECGGGLHGALWGEGDGTLFDWDPHATWQVVEVDADSVVDLGGKVKFPRGEVVYSGDRKGATEVILAHPGGKGRAVIGAEVSVENRKTAIAGDYGTAIAGDYGTAIVGDRGRSVAGYGGIVEAGKHSTVDVGNEGKARVGIWSLARVGDRGEARAGYKGKAFAGCDGKAAAGDGGIATAGDRGKAQVGDKGTADAGDDGTAEAGRYGKATVGDRGTATAGRHGKAIVGEKGKAMVGIYGKAMAGKDGRITIEWYDKETKQYRLSTGYIGEDGLLPDIMYRVNEKGDFIPCE